MERPSPATPPIVPASSAGPLLRSFLFDVLIATLLVIATSVAVTVAWMVWRAAALAAQGQDAAQIEKALGQPEPLAQMLVVLLTGSVSALVLYRWRRRADAGERAASHAALRQPSTWGWTGLVAAAVFLGSASLGWLGQWLGIEPVPSNLALVEAAAAQWPMLLFLFAVVLAPAYEELLFRRVFFGRFLAAGRPWLGLVVSSLAFALIHELPGVSANPPLAILQLWLIYGGMGAAFAWLYWRTGTLWAPFFAHALNNAAAIAVYGLT
jgi:membrane protease YdiL (CAAX protease family)